ncbi:unnamed protein product, partial [Didymodactylos carnosus]
MFETLPSEVLLDEIFVYLSIQELFHSLFSLNRRIDNLLISYTRHINLSLLSLRDFSIYCNVIFPIVTPNLISLTLSNEFIHHLIYAFTEAVKKCSFSNLQSLTLIGVCNDEIKHIMEKLNNYSSLIIINKHQCSFDGNLFNNRSLKFCSMENIYFQHLPYCSKIVHLKINILNIYDLQKLINSIDHLQILNLTLSECEKIMDYDEFKKSIKIHPKELISFQLNIVDNHNFIFTQLEYLMKHYISPCRLQTFIFHNNYSTDTNYIRGYQWQTLLSLYPNLLKFHFYIGVSIHYYCGHKREIINDIDSFRTKFWINENRQWFIHYSTYHEINGHWCGTHQYERIIMYSLPYYFNSLHVMSSDYQTTLIDNNLLMYKKVRHLYYDWQSSMPLVTVLKQCPNIKTLLLEGMHDENDTGDELCNMNIKSLKKINLLDDRYFHMTNRRVNVDYLARLLKIAPNIYYIKDNYDHLKQLITSIPNRCITHLHLRYEGVKYVYEISLSFSNFFPNLIYLHMDTIFSQPYNFYIKNLLVILKSFPKLIYFSIGQDVCVFLNDKEDDCNSMITATIDEIREWIK